MACSLSFVHFKIVSNQTHYRLIFERYRCGAGSNCVSYITNWSEKFDIYLTVTFFQIMEPLNNVEGLKEQNEGILSLDENENYCNCLLEIQQWRLRNLKKERKRHLKHKCINKKRNGKTRRELFSNVDIPLDDEWSTSFEENGPKVEEVLKDCANLDLGDLNYYLREIKVEESIAEMPNEKMELVYEDMFTDNVDKTEEDNLSKMSGDDLEKSIVDLVLDLENEIATENTNAMKAPIGFDLEEDVFPEVQRLVLKYGSLNPLLNGSTPESSLHK